MFKSYRCLNITVENKNTNSKSIQSSDVAMLALKYDDDDIK